MSTTTKPVNQKAWFLILPVIICVAFSAILPLMTVVNYSVQDIISPETRLPSAGDTVWLQVLGEHTCYYQNEELLA